MEKIINIRERIENQRFKRLQEQYRKQIDSIRKLTQCSSCRLRCTMCGLYIDEQDSSRDPDTSDQRYNFCESCRGEFEAYLSLSRGEKISQVFWHNKEWEKMWSAWLSYQQAINDFMDSPEFILLLEELEAQP